jgi:two-component sensor histidine kinase
VLLPIDSAIPSGLVVTELISNALKHAFRRGEQGEISVTLTRESSGCVVLAVSDNGVGIPEHVSIADSSTLGLQLVTILADQLGGSVTMQRSNPTRLVLRFPAQRPTSGVE